MGAIRRSWLRQRQCALPRAQAGDALLSVRALGALRRHCGARRRLLRRCAGADRRADRPQRRGQDHALQLPVAALHLRAKATSCSKDTRILAQPRHAIAELGIGRTFQNVALFDRMSVLRQCQGGLPPPHLDRLHHQRPCACRTRDGEERRITERARGADRLHGPQAVRATSGRRTSASGRRSAWSWRARWPAIRSCSCSTNPQPASTTTRSTCCAGRSARIRDTQNVTVLLVEHHMSLVMSVSDKVVAHRLRQEDRRRHAGRGAAATRT